MKTRNYLSTAIFLLLAISSFSQSREIELEDIDNSGDVIIEMITNDLPTDATHRNMLLGFNQSSEGFLRMVSDHDLSFWTNNNRRMTIDNDGKIGIGESSPLVRLHVKSSGVANQQTIVSTFEANASNRPLILLSEGGSLLSSGMSIEYDGRLNGDDNKLYFNGIDGLPKTTITAGGKMGVGVTSPTELLDVNGNIGLKNGTGKLNFYEGATIKSSISHNGTSLIISANETAGDISLNPADDAIFDAGDDILFRSGGITRMFMNDSGDFGVGTTAPAGKLDIRHTSTSTDPILYLRQLSGDFARMRMTSNSTTEFWNIEGRSLGTDPEYNIVYSDNGTLKTNLSIDGDGQRTGINNNSPNASLHIKQVGSNIEGLRIENDSDTDNWGFEVGGNDLVVTFNGAQVGIFNDADGVYSPSSDIRLKENIQDLETSEVDKLMQLRPTTYYFKHDTEKIAKSYGFIAQEVLEILPDAVIISDKEDSDLLAIKYQNLNVIAIKAIQEQQKLIENLQKQIDELKK